ncbi:MAG: aminotransferase class IV [Chloroflexota bacterium]
MKAYQVFENYFDEIEIPEVGSTLDSITTELPQGLYTTFRTFENRKKAVDIHFHLGRLFNHLADDKITPSVQPETLLMNLRQILSSMDGGDVKIRLILSLSDTPGQVYFLIDKLAVIDQKIYERGVVVITSRTHRNNPRLKSTAFIQKSQEIRELLKEQNIYEAIMIDQNDRMLEGITSNFYGVINNKIRTARDGILLGVTRKEVIRLCRKIGLEIDYNPLRIADLNQISEAFMTSSSRGVVPIVKIDSVVIGNGNPGPLTTHLKNEYDQYISKKVDYI